MLSLLPWLLAPLASASDERCSLELSRPPEVAPGEDFVPERKTCARFSAGQCRTTTRPSPDDLGRFDYSITCSPRKAKPKPSPRNELAALKSGPWLDGVAVVVPSDITCMTERAVRGGLMRAFPRLVNKRDDPPEQEPRLRVWMLQTDPDGTLSVTGPGVSTPAKGPAPGLVPAAVCRSPVGPQRSRTQLIVATCKGQPQPQIREGCPGDSLTPIQSDVRRLVSRRNDPGAGYLKSLEAIDDRVKELTEGPKTSKPQPKPDRCTESGPVPLAEVRAVWTDGRDPLGAVAEDVRADRCTVVPADLDPEGTVQAFTKSLWENQEDQAGLEALWAEDAAFGRALLLALDASTDDTPVLWVEALRDLGQTALDSRPPELEPRDIEAYEASRQALFSRIDEAAATIDQVVALADDAQIAYDALVTEFDDWPDHAGSRLDELEDRREQLSLALRGARLDGGLRDAGKGLVLELLDLVERIEQDAMHQVLVEGEAIADRLANDPDMGDFATLTGPCADAVEQARASVPAATTLERARDARETFEQQRLDLDRAARGFDPSACALAERQASLLRNRVSNLEVESDRVDPSTSDHPRRSEATSLLKRVDRWLKRAR